MKESFGSGDPARDLAEEYRLFATTQREASLRSDEREAVIDDFEALRDRRGTSDRVVGALAQLRLAEAIQLAEARRPLEAAPLFAEVDELLADAAGGDVVGPGAAKQKAIVEWAKSRTESNCGWGDYAVAQLILHEAAVIEHARKAKGAGT